ncbi:hypothetical protein C4K68_25350 [Pokkaliibacter plantistimulans]|uniref:Acyltransferase n=1 Tax=Proteobacteria bacterium 228 TaxID=2083153 RepID=A0A2S5KIQ7_9PROT|nr:hypothetical protein [Pokkaliibacter plantistimulans]PPC74642.1 hypothetical protein C4K68_25350 [Pokkaliibacter plantistimulans]
MQNTQELNIEANDGNDIVIPTDCKFIKSRIIVKGTGNIIHISPALSYNRLMINIRGNNKEIYISESKKNINNLRITSIRGEGQKVYIGKDFSCGGLEIQMNDGNENLSIGDNCLFSWGIKIRTSDGHSVVDLATDRAINLPKDVVIKDRVWISEDVRILKGVLVPEDCVIASAAVVTKTFSDDDKNTVIGGFPAKVLKRNIKWDRRMPSEYNSGK